VRLRSIQVLRGLAASSVVMLHATGSFPKGAVGVDLFFVISGFIMAHVSRGRTPGDFLFDRFWRIYPLWLFALIPWIWWTHPDLPRLISSVTLWPIIDGWQTPALRVGWTLSFEMLFYFAVAASLRIGVKPLLALFGLMLCGAYVVRWPIFNYLGNPMVFEFLFGVLIARSPRLPELSIPLVVVALVVLAFSPAWVGQVYGVTLQVAAVWRVLYWGIPAALIVYACVSSEAQFASERWALPLLIGDASYSIYLFHPALIEVPLPWWLKFVVAVVGSVAVWWLVERNIIALKPKLRGLNQRNVAGVGAASGEVESDSPARAIGS